MFPQVFYTSPIPYLYIDIQILREKIAKNKANCSVYLQVAVDIYASGIPGFTFFSQ